MATAVLLTGQAGSGTHFELTVMCRASRLLSPGYLPSGNIVINLTARARRPAAAAGLVTGSKGAGTCERKTRWQPVAGFRHTGHSGGVEPAAALCLICRAQPPHRQACPQGWSEIAVCCSRHTAQVTLSDAAAL
eukprot:scaffold86850_cov71-Phaeocystis_antarctica.AAC.1